jgi:hypothetical protein
MAEGAVTGVGHCMECQRKPAYAGDNYSLGFRPAGFEGEWQKRLE